MRFVVPPELEEKVTKAAEAEHMTPQEWVLQTLRRRIILEKISAEAERVERGETPPEAGEQVEP
jgi:hypothetical protein